MKKLLALLLTFYSLSVFAFDHAYNVTGVADNLGPVDGSAYANDGESKVYGEVIDQDGNVHSFEGLWTGNGMMSGETDDGDTVQLTTR